jgi:hypothetical protein
MPTNSNNAIHYYSPAKHQASLPFGTPSVSPINPIVVGERHTYPARRHQQSRSSHHPLLLDHSQVNPNENIKIKLLIRRFSTHPQPSIKAYAKLDLWSDGIFEKIRARVA